MRLKSQIINFWFEVINIVIVSIIIKLDINEVHL